MDERTVSSGLELDWGCLLEMQSTFVTLWWKMARLGANNLEHQFVQHNIIGLGSLNVLDGIKND